MIGLIFAILFGACIGSFLNVVVYRMPRGLSLAFPPSHCPSCGKHIKWRDNIPAISWILLKGKCRFCSAPISSRYIKVEALTAFLVGGLYACYFILHLRDGVDYFADSWPVFIAHAVLVVCLLACSLIDVEHWIVPLEVCWFASIVGVVLMTFGTPPQTILPRVSPVFGAMCISACIGLGVSIILQRIGVFTPSFIDANDKATVTREDNTGKETITAVAASKEHGINPRKEILREVLFLCPAIILSAVGWFLFSKVSLTAQWWADLSDPAYSLGKYLTCFQAAIAGYVVGGAWVWGIRIFGTLGFGKEAMGLGDVHILAAVGAVCGWIVPTVVFFVAPFFGLVWAMRLFVSRKQKELPYGPWLAAAAVLVMLFNDVIVDVLKTYFK